MRISDWSSDGCSSDLDDVRAILNSLGANGPQDGGEGDAPEAIPQIEIWNKMDTADVDRRAIIEEMAARRPDVAVISAVTGEGVEAARILMASQLTAAHRVQRIHLGYEQGEAMAWLHARGEVLADRSEEHTSELQSLMRISYAVF